MEEIADSGDGRFRSAAPLTFGPTHLAPACSAMAKQHPLLQISTSYSDRFVDLIAEGFDCAVRTVRPLGRFKADNGAALLTAALDGLGVALLPDGITGNHLASGALAPVMKGYPLHRSGKVVAARSVAPAASDLLHSA